ncbi:hypothetical protein CVT25_002868 [Psilocybe cyanescens]|uniref:Uncharacterized protein n=1 Tax=Psilocybe cyanescens TaxID=93625 RepID=A0A409X4Z6_PSICY|nr:hypothetical protein CVT25_002868 [Psilocybe cyanescens]
MAKSKMKSNAKASAKAWGKPAKSSVETKPSGTDSIGRKREGQAEEGEVGGDVEAEAGVQGDVQEAKEEEKDVDEEVVVALRPRSTVRMKAVVGAAATSDSAAANVRTRKQPSPNPTIEVTIPDGNLPVLEPKWKCKPEA